MIRGIFNIFGNVRRDEKSQSKILYIGFSIHNIRTSFSLISSFIYIYIYIYAITLMLKDLSRGLGLI